MHGIHQFKRPTNHSCEPVGPGSKNNYGVPYIMQSTVLSSGRIVNIAADEYDFTDALFHCQKLCDCGLSSVRELGEVVQHEQLCAMN